MNFDLFQVDAFTELVFGGNPAAVVPLKCWLLDDVLLNIANENNLSETAFFIPSKEDGIDYDLRWFTPLSEVDLCGHATLAAAHVLYGSLGYALNSLSFNTKSGILKVKRLGKGTYLLDFPADHGIIVKEKSIFESILNCKIKELYKGKDDFLAILDNEAQLMSVSPDFRAMKKFNSRGLIISSRGEMVDFVSRSFYPALGIDEDPATGSAHTLLTPYWAIQLKKNRLKAIQMSSRRGYFDCIYRVQRVGIIGSAKLYLTGIIEI